MAHDQDTTPGAGAAGFPIHPLATPGNRSGAFGLNARDRFVHDPDGRRGRADEFLSDGDAFVTWDDGTWDCVRWNQMSPEPAPGAGRERGDTDGR